MTRVSQHILIIRFQAVMGTEYKPSGSEDADLYATWTPPVNQTGDGRTALNDKLGY